MRSFKPFAPAPPAQCIFEHVYFARPDSYVFGESVNEVRTNLGRLLAREQPAEADVVVPVPDSGVCAAIGFAEESGIPMRVGLIRNHYVGPHVHRAAAVDPAFRRQGEAESGAQHPRRQARGAGGRFARARHDEPQDRQDDEGGRGAEIHLRISCPPTVSPCFYGIDTPRRSELIAATHTLEEIRKYIEADSVGYLSLEGLLSSVGTRASSYCTSCYTGQYPVAFPRNEAAYLQLALKLDGDPVKT